MSKIEPGSRIKRLTPGLLLLLSVAIGTAAWIAFKPPREVTPLESSNTDSTAHQEGEIIFASLSGTPPRYIDAGPDRGTGWQEYETQEIRKSLRESGIPNRLEWMTPARIEHEIRVKNPICFWPLKWSHPEEVFAKKPDRLYSIPLTLEGDNPLKILINRDDEKRFQRHTDSKGDLSLESLLADPSLKTIFIRDFDYGPITRKVTRRGEDGDQDVQEAYRKYVDLILVRDNRQLLEMLRAKRFDYILSSAIGEEDYQSTHIDPTSFKEFTYQSKALTSLSDPNLVMSSIVCAIHPLTLKALPTINSQIASLRGIQWVDAKSRYRSQLDSSYLNFGGFSDSPVHNFRGAFDSGGADQWYRLQQRYFPDLLLFPPSAVTQAFPILPERAPSPRWAMVSQEDGNVITLLNESSVPGKAPWANPVDPLQIQFHVYPYDFLAGMLSESQNSAVRDPKIFSDSKSSATFSELHFPAHTPPTQLTLFGFGLSLSEVQKTLPILSGLKSLAAFGLNPEASAWLVDHLPPQLEKLNLTSCSLTRADLPQKIRNLPLRALLLPNSQISQAQMKRLVPALPTTLEELSLAYHRNSFDEEVVHEIQNHGLPNLKKLDLENCMLRDSLLIEMDAWIREPMKSLNLGTNWLTPQSVFWLFKKKLDHLVELNLSGNAVVSALPTPVRLPPRLKRLNLSNSNLNKNTLTRIEFPTALELLDVSENNLSKANLRPLMHSLGEEVQFVSLAGSHLGVEVAEALAQSGIKSISELHLEKNSLGDQGLEALAKASFQVNRLYLSSNRIRNKGAEIIAKTWLPQLVSLNLSENPISEAGTRILASNLPAKMEELSLASLFSLDASFLAKRLPQSLLTLNLSGNQLSDSDLRTLAPRLPTTLTKLNLGGANLGEEGAWSLARFLPPHLSSLDLKQTHFTPSGIGILARALPGSLSRLSLGPAVIDPLGVEQLASHLPRALTFLSVYRFAASGADLAPLLNALPNSLIKFNLESTDLSASASTTMGSHWPPTLREFYYGGNAIPSSSTLFKKVPETLERLALYGAQLTDAGIQAIASHPLEHLHEIEWSGNRFTTQGFNQFLTPDRRFWYLETMNNPNLDRLFLAKLPEKLSRSLRFIAINNVPLGSKEIETLCRKLKKGAMGFDFTSTQLSYQGLDRVLKAIPGPIGILGIRGTNIGDAGRKRVEAYAQEQEQTTGVPLKILN